MFRTAVKSTRAGVTAPEVRLLRVFELVGMQVLGDEQIIKVRNCICSISTREQNSLPLKIIVSENHITF